MKRETYHVATGNTVTDRDRVLDLWDRCGFGAGRSVNEARYDWFYISNPQGTGRVYLLFADSDGELVGASGVGVRLFHSPGRGSLTGGVLVDFVVLPEHRTLFPALQLQRAVRQGELQHCDFVYGLPDTKAVPVVRRLGGNIEFSSSTYVRIIRSADFLRRVWPGVPAVLLTLVSSAVDALLKLRIRAEIGSAGIVAQAMATPTAEFDVCQQRLVAAGQVAVGDRSGQTLKWRSLAPFQSIRTLAFRDSWSQQVLGYALFTLDARSMHVVDFLLPSDSASARGVLLALSLEAAKLGAGVVRIDFGGSTSVARQLTDAGYHCRDSRPGVLIARPGGEAALPKAWWFTRADEDV